MKRLAIALSLTLVSCAAVDTPKEAPKAVLPSMSVEDVLMDYHDAAAKADAKRLFGHLAEGAVIYGTDSEEEWPLEKFKALVGPLLAKGQGWVTSPTRQLVTIAPCGRRAWFFENLTSSKWGEMRGSGFCRVIDGAWKIDRMVLSFPIPNDMVPDLTKRIGARK